MVVVCLLLTLALPLLADAQNPIIAKSAYCDEKFIYFTVNFHNRFTGFIYTDGTYGDARCKYVDGIAFPSAFYNISIPLNGCGSENYPNGTKRNTIIVQRDPRILESWDNKFVLTCNPRTGVGLNNPFEGPLTVTLGGITVDGSLTSTELVTDFGNSVDGIDYDVQVQLGVGPYSIPVNRPLRVGEPISYVVRLNNFRNFRARVGRCWANDGVSDIQLSDDRGCSVQPPSSNVWNQFQEVDQGTTKVFFNNIKTWAFPTSNRVNIFCNLHMCPGGCPVVNCRAEVELPFDNTVNQFSSSRNVRESYEDDPNPNQRIPRDELSQTSQQQSFQHSAQHDRGRSTEKYPESPEYIPPPPPRNSKSSEVSAPRRPPPRSSEPSEASAPRVSRPQQPAFDPRANWRGGPPVPENGYQFSPPQIPQIDAPVSYGGHYINSYDSQHDAEIEEERAFISRIRRDLPISERIDAIAALPITIEGGFEIKREGRENDLIGQQAHQVGVVTGEPVSGSIQSENLFPALEEAARKEICMLQSYFIAGVSLLSLIICISFGVICLLVHRSSLRKKQRDQRTDAPPSPAAPAYAYPHTADDFREQRTHVNHS